MKRNYCRKVKPLDNSRNFLPYGLRSWVYSLGLKSQECFEPGKKINKQKTKQKYWKIVKLTLFYSTSQAFPGIASSSPPFTVPVAPGISFRGTLLHFIFHRLKRNNKCMLSFALQADPVLQTLCPRDILYKRLLGDHHNLPSMLSRSVLENVLLWEWGKEGKPTFVTGIS